MTSKVGAGASKRQEKSVLRRICFHHSEFAQRPRQNDVDANLPAFSGSHLGISHLTSKSQLQTLTSPKLRSVLKMDIARAGVWCGGIHIQ